ncbi:phosphoribosylformylglycinamidine synthase subunit PurQ [Vulgatibacter sp.]|uniref:phosphoribosylformylglycinamidine synthase subunit PurQ n=1 Tax=Vulgatibacter sp. TaxID=1971226 RepID=UPI003569D7C0
MRFGIVVFPGSNCDHDAYHAVKHVMGADARFIWHKDRDLSGLDCVVLPGGFSYGDYLRSGAIARFSPVMEEVVAFAKKGGKVLGICNGFQILLEAGLLPGAMRRNDSLKFVCKDVWLRTETSETPFTRTIEKGSLLRIPIAHAEGNYFLDDEGLESLEGNGQVVFRYVEADGRVTANANPNGARNNIAGIVNEQKNVLGMMPHPERLCEGVLGGEDGKKIFESLMGAAR